MGQILPNLAAELEAAKAVIAKQQELIAALNKPKAISFKVTAQKMNEKTGKLEGTSGAISIYGLGRFPITLYRSQAERLIDNIPALQAFIAANASLLATKD